MLPLENEQFQGGHIESVLIGAETAKVAYQTRECKQFNFIFHHCYAVYEHGAVNLDVARIGAETRSRLADEVLRELTEARKDPAPQQLWHVTFYESWQNRPILEIVCETAGVMECGRAADLNAALYDIRGEEYVGGDFPPEFA